MDVEECYALMCASEGALEWTNFDSSRSRCKQPNVPRCLGGSTKGMQRDIDVVSPILARGLGHDKRIRLDNDFRSTKGKAMTTFT